MIRKWHPGTPLQFLKGLRIESRDHPGLPKQFRAMLVTDHLKTNKDFYRHKR